MRRELNLCIWLLMAILAHLIYYAPSGKCPNPKWYEIVVSLTQLTASILTGGIATWKTILWFLTKDKP